MFPDTYRHMYTNTHTCVHEYMVGGANPKIHADMFPKNVPLIEGLNNNKETTVPGFPLFHIYCFFNVGFSLVGFMTCIVS